MQFYMMNIPETSDVIRGRRQNGWTWSQPRDLAEEDPFVFRKDQRNKAENIERNIKQSLNVQQALDLFFIEKNEEGEPTSSSSLVKESGAEDEVTDPPVVFGHDR